MSVKLNILIGRLRTVDKM